MDRAGAESCISYFIDIFLPPSYCHTVVDPGLRWANVPGRRERKAHYRAYRLLGFPAVGGRDRLAFQSSGFAKHFLEIQRRSVKLPSKALRHCVAFASQYLAACIGRKDSLFPALYPLFPAWIRSGDRFPGAGKENHLIAGPRVGDKPFGAVDDPPVFYLFR